jgi:hypothetical protein
LKSVELVPIFVAIVLLAGGLVAVATLVQPQTVPSAGTITVNGTNVFHPAGCDATTDKVSAVGGLTLTLETTLAPAVGSPICLLFVLANNNPQPFPAYRYLMVINVTDGSGAVVYHTAFGVVSPPGRLYNITQGAYWENGGYWNPAQSSVAVSAGTYYLTAALTLPGSTSGPVIEAGNSVQITQT